MSAKNPFATLLISQAEVLELLPIAACIPLMEEALRALALDQALQPLRQVLWLPDKMGVLVTMPSFLAAAEPAGGILGLKTISVFPGNLTGPYDSHQGVVLAFDAQNGRLLAIIDATAITAIRTAAVSAVATRLLAHPRAGDLALLGSGTQARSHLEAMFLARPLRRVRLWSRNPENARRFADQAAQKYPLKVEVMPTAQAAVQNADLICTTTSASQPVLRGEWLSPGCHINAIGSSVPSARELDSDAVLKARLYVDRRESALNEAGDFLIPRQEGLLGDDHIRGEIGDLLIGRSKDRRSDDDITLFKSLGLSIEDLACARYIYDQALEFGRGSWIELGGRRAE
jgi:ornithine cyclodeaminase/alanine dehydrogenase-like protein (mu-crystallin family)